MMKNALRIAMLAVLMLVATSAYAGKLGFGVNASIKDRTLTDGKLAKVVVNKLVAASPAAKSGLKVGDVIEKVNGVPIAGASARKLYSNFGSIKRGQKVILDVNRKGVPMPITIVAE